LFRDWQCVHIRSQGDHGAIPSAAQHARHARNGYPGVHLHAECAKVVRDEASGAKFPVRKLRVLMHVAPPGDHLIFDLRREAVDLRNLGYGGEKRGYREEERDGEREEGAAASIDR
jgi:hypothetical protein